jgi:glutathione S-transferase
MPPQDEGPLEEVALLARAVDTVFRKLIRFLVGRISLARLLEMIRHIYVEEAELALKADLPGRNVPLTRLALVTGLDTRTLVQIRKQLESGDEQHREKYLAELTPESAIVEAWAERVKRAPEKDRAAQLSYGEENAGFETLVKSTISIRGITMQSIIQRLVDTRSVEQDKANRTLELVVDHYSPYLSDDEPSIVNAAFSAISNMISTIEHNVQAEQDEKFYQRQFWTFRLSVEDRAGFRAATFDMLERYEALARREMAPWEGSDYGEEKLTAGIGFYYFEDTQE